MEVKPMTDPRLEIVSNSAAAAGLTVRMEGTRCLVFYPRFAGALKQYEGDIAVEVRLTPLGLRYFVYEQYAGYQLAPYWPSDIGYWLQVQLGEALADVYWWSYRSWWGWLDTHRWVSLQEASCTATSSALVFHQECLLLEAQP
jgi:hypothetical protein